MRQVECTINGIGERAGNASLEEIVMALRVRPDRLPYDTGDPDRRRCSRRASCSSTLTGEPVQANKAIVGRNAFAHEAGIHQDGMLKDARTYEIMRPEDVGQSVASRLVLGRHSGRHAVQRRCEALGFTLTHDEIDAGLPRGHLARRAPQGDRRRRSAPHRRARAHAGVGRRRREPGARRSRRLRTRGISRMQIADADCRLRDVVDRSTIESLAICNLPSAICNIIRPGASRPGTRLGAYEIVSLLGAGGMGEVYRARDTKLNRDVAIKVLLPAVADDPDRLARFQREAQVLASLNHPNIAAIYGLEDARSGAARRS